MPLQGGGGGGGASGQWSRVLLDPRTWLLGGSCSCCHDNPKVPLPWHRALQRQVEIWAWQLLNVLPVLQIAENL